MKVPTSLSFALLCIVGAATPGPAYAQSARPASSLHILEARARGTGLAHAPWPCFRGNAQSTALAREGNAMPARSWVFETIPSPPSVVGIFSSPAIGADGTVYFGADSLYALDGATGVKRWEFFTGSGMFNSTPAISSDGVLYAGCDDYFLYAIDAASGKMR